MFFRLLLFFGCLAFLLAWSRSDQPAVSVMVPENPFAIAQGAYQWDGRTSDATQLGNVRILNWATVRQAATNRPDTVKNYFITWDEMEYMIKNNVFDFSRIGICTKWYPSVSDLFGYIGYRRFLYPPDTFTLSKMLSAPDQEPARMEMLDRTVRLLKDPGTKVQWEIQRASFINLFSDWIRNDKNSAFRADYSRIANATYENSLQAAFTNLVLQMDNTDFSLKVIPFNNRWKLVVVINDIFEIVNDESPLGINSVCYRMGPEATQKARSYVLEAKQRFISD